MLLVIQLLNRSVALIKKNLQLKQKQDVSMTLGDSIHEYQYHISKKNTVIFPAVPVRTVLPEAC